jgi:tripartite-type tricarboxylate transporter receptor subunit TctC
LADPDLKRRFEELGDKVFLSSRVELAKLIIEDTEKWGKVIRAAGIKAE